jgi:tRNA (guanine26-N2/guanine27-N2)-dimethyltransferase
VSFVDCLCGIGARGIRVAKEVPGVSRVYFNDINSKAIGLAKQSSFLNEIESKCNFSNEETCSFLLSKSQSDVGRFGITDVDPFGTPSPFVESAIRSTEHDGLISLTATDSAVLCGVYPQVALRKYLGLPLRTDYCHEMGLRLMLGLVAMTAMRLETGIVPLFSHHDRHYFRIYFQLKVGNNYSIENECNIGFVAHCFKCGFRTTIKRTDFIEGSSGISVKNISCPSCKALDSSKSSLKIGGPCWVGKLESQDFVEECSLNSDLGIFLSHELQIPLYYDLSSLTQDMGLRTPKLDGVMDELLKAGFTSSRTRHNPNAIRTEAPLADLRFHVSKLAR